MPHINTSLTDLYEQFNARRRRNNVLACVACCVVIPALLALVLHLCW